MFPCTSIYSQFPNNYFIHLETYLSLWQDIWRHLRCTNSRSEARLSLLPSEKLISPSRWSSLSEAHTITTMPSVCRPSDSHMVLTATPCSCSSSSSCQPPDSPDPAPNPSSLRFGPAAGAHRPGSPRHPRGAALQFRCKSSLGGWASPLEVRVSPHRRLRDASVNLQCEGSVRRGGCRDREREMRGGRERKWGERCEIIEEKCEGKVIFSRFLFLSSLPSLKTSLI